MFELGLLHELHASTAPPLKDLVAIFMRLAYALMMRTTLNLDDQLLRQAKKLAAESGQTLTSLFEDALRERLARRGAAQRKPVRLKTFGTGGVQPGIDLNDSAALLDAMER